MNTHVQNDSEIAVPANPVPGEGLGMNEPDSSAIETSMNELKDSLVQCGASEEDAPFFRDYNEDGPHDPAAGDETEECPHGVPYCESCEDCEDESLLEVAPLDYWDRVDAAIDDMKADECEAFYGFYGLL